VSNATTVLYFIIDGAITVVRVGVIKIVVTVFDFKNKKYFRKIKFSREMSNMILFIKNIITYGLF
jgi:hypothetical protein